MLLIEIDKSRYRRHFNIVLVACIGFLAVSSVAIAQLLIYLFPAEEGTHFHWNLIGVIISALIAWAVITKNKTHPFLHEVFFVWQLKQALNLITRKMAKLNKAAKMGDEHPMLALQFSYTGSRKLWMLDDNIITMNSLDKSQHELDELLIKYNISVDINQYNRDLLKSF